MKLLLKDQYISGVSLVKCDKISIKQNFDYECDITIQMNDKYEKGIKVLRNELGICQNDKYISIDRNYCYLPRNKMIARKRLTFITFDVRNYLNNNFNV